MRSERRPFHTLRLLICLLEPHAAARLPLNFHSIPELRFWKHLAIDQSTPGIHYRSVAGPQKPGPLSKQLSPQQTCVPHCHLPPSSLLSPHCHTPAYSAWTLKRSWLHPAPALRSVALLLILLRFTAEPLIPKVPTEDSRKSGQ